MSSCHLQPCLLFSLRSFLHSFTHSLTHSFTHPFIHSFIHSPIHSFITNSSFIHSPIHSLTHPLIHHELIIHSLTHSFTDPTKFIPHLLSLAEEHEGGEDGVGSHPRGTVAWEGRSSFPHKCLGVLRGCGGEPQGAVVGVHAPRRGASLDLDHMWPWRGGASV